MFTSVRPCRSNRAYSVPDSLLDTGHDLSFDELAKLRAHLQRILATASDSLQTFHFEKDGGFVHKVTPGEPPPKWSKSSSATCLAFLRATGSLDEEPWCGEKGLIGPIVRSKWKSAGLLANNPFTVSFLLEALAELGGGKALTDSQWQTVDEKLGLLEGDILGDGEAGGARPEDRGGVRLQEYAATAFLTFKAVSALSRWDRLGKVSDAVTTWAWNHLNKESVLVASASPDSDVFEVAYSVLIASEVTPLDRMAPQQRLLLRHAIDQFFSAQSEDGTWPRSRPLFVYPQYGHAYCFDYELLAAMLKDPQLRPFVYARLGGLRRAAEGLDERKYPLGPAGRDGETAYGWASGHHGADPRPESWSTASALHFCFELSDLVGEAIRIATFEDVGVTYKAPRLETPQGPALPKWFLDSRIQLDGSSHTTLKAQMAKRFIEPLREAREQLDYGKPLPKTTPSSAILYGPPGTSKTELARLIAQALGWPFLPLDPSHLTRQGLDQVHAEANRLFRMLQQCERIVVLLDEFDELMRDREGGELESRFLTTAMLPKLTTLSKERRLVYLVATNHIERFDAAIRRPDRFDLVIPVMPPTIKAKRTEWPALDAALKAIDSLGEEEAEEAKAVLSDLTFSEAKELDKEVSALKGSDTGKLNLAFVKAGRRATLRQRVNSNAGGGGDGTWRSEILAQRERIRLG